ncbi:MAG: anion permease [Chloroflexia bacterium]|nr:anion permease [Chloroflexia bacterium]
MPQIILLLAIIGVALVLFALERLPADVIALGLLLTLVLTGLLPVEQAFSGFGSDTVMMILGLLILTAVLVRTGVVDLVGSTILRLIGDHPSRLILILMVAVALLSGFMSNTATTAFFVPIIIGLSHQLRLNPSKLLMPLAFSAILASSLTVISSSTNIVVSGVLSQHGLEPIGMFELTLVGLPVAVVGLIYMQFLGRHLVPARADAEEAEEDFAIRPYMAELLVLSHSPLVDKTLAEAALGRDLDLTVLRVRRDKIQFLAPKASLQLKEGDVLTVQGQRDRILKVKDVVGVAIKADVELSDPELQTGEMGLVEVILLPKSPLIGRTLKGLNFRQRYGLQVLGINHHGEPIARKLSRAYLRVGDQLLVQGRRSNIAALDLDGTFRVVSTVSYQRVQRRRAPIAIGIFAGVVLLAALEVVALPIAVLLGAVIAFVTRCITPEEAYRTVEWKLLILIGSMLAVGQAMEYTGTAQFLADQVVNWIGAGHPLWLLSAFFALTMLLTQPLSNQAAAVIVLPVAIQAALQAGLNPRAFAIMIAVGASCSFITPLEPSCLIVYGPGRYRFVDFVKVGSPLTVLIYLIAIVLVPLIWPL